MIAIEYAIKIKSTLKVISRIMSETKNMAPTAIAET